jgi:hypothetical protein
MSPTPPSVLLAKCTTTLVCYLRTVPLWAAAILLLLFAALRNRLSTNKVIYRPTYAGVGLNRKSPT